MRIIGYSLAVTAAVVAGRRELRAPARDDGNCWPRFWFLSAVLLSVMGAAQTLELGEIISDLGRDRARLGGWYEMRRSLQAILIGSVVALWSVSVFTAISRVPERRWRYLPAVIVLFTLVCFAVIRVVSLHQVESLLYHREFLGLRIVAVTELSLLAAAILTTFWFPLHRGPRIHASPGSRC